MSEETYLRLYNDNPILRSQLEKFNIALYRGDETLALKMLLHTKKFAYFDLDENGFMQADKDGDSVRFINQLKELQKQFVSALQGIGIDVSYGDNKQYFEDMDLTQDIDSYYEESSDRTMELNPDFYIQIEDEHLYIENLQELGNRMITGLTPITEGDIELDGECFATTAIGKARDNQEDAVLLIKDSEIPGFKMMIVADGMGGEERGEVASHILVTKLKKWFESLDHEEKEKYYADVTKIEDDLRAKIQEISFEIESELYGIGGTTLVCAVIGENNTIVTNVGDSRGYIIRNGRLEQVTKDDAVVQKKYEEGKIPTKDAMRFHEHAHKITQAVGLGLIDDIHVSVLDNSDYDMLLLFSDVVTDCLSEEDIAVICKTTDRKDVAKVLAQKAIEHDSIVSESLYDELEIYNFLIPGGKDNTTVASFVPKKDEEER